MSFSLNKVRQHFQWTIHNIVAHPLMEVLHLVGFTELGDKVHRCTIPRKINIINFQNSSVGEDLKSTSNPERNN